ncbi:MAG: hypothetical protein RTU09_01020 [Candidatus Thorarchaeota archaeon]
MYSAEKIDDEGFVECQNCAKQMSVRMSDEGAVATSAEKDPMAIKPSFLETAASVEGINVKCPNCGAKYIYTDEQRLEDGRVNCQNCATIIDAVGDDVVITRNAMVSEESESINAWLWCVIILILAFVPWIFSVPIVIWIVWQHGRRRGSKTIVRKRSTGPGLN